MHADVPVWLTGNVSMGHGEGVLEGDEEGRESCQMDQALDIYMKNGGEGDQGPLHPSRTIKDDQAGS